MKLGPITIRWTKDVQVEQATRDKAKAVSAAITELLMHELRRSKAILHRWGVSEGVIKGKVVK